MHHEKSFVPAFFKVSIHNLESGKRNCCFGRKYGKVLNFGSKDMYKPCCYMLWGIFFQCKIIFPQLFPCKTWNQSTGYFFLKSPIPWPPPPPPPHFKSQMVGPLLEVTRELLSGWPKCGTGTWWKWPLNRGFIYNDLVFVTILLLSTH